MSIDEELQAAVERGLLRPLPMRMDSDPQARLLLLSEEVCQLVLGPYQTKAQSERAGRLRADLENYVRGKNITLCLTPRKARRSDFGLLEPSSNCVWDYRSRDPKPGLRLLGHFADVDKFVALTWWPRSVPVDWSDKVPLGDRNDKKHEARWRDAINDCAVKWFDVLPNSIPVGGEKVEKYVSGNFLLG